MVGRVLVVEDDEDTRDTLALLLRVALEVTVETARDGEEARQLLQEGHFDLVLTDERMPRLRGTELLRWMRREQPGVHRALMTAYHDGPELAQEAGAEVFLTKPLDLDAVLTEIQRLVPSR